MILWPIHVRTFLSISNSTNDSWLSKVQCRTHKCSIILITLMLLHPFQTCWFLVAQLLYKSKCPSVCMYVCLSVCLSGLGGNVILSAPNWDIAKFFCVCRFPNNYNILIFCSLESAFKRCKRHHFISINYF